MAITVTSRKYWSELINGTDFLTLPSDVTTNLVGSVMEKIRAEMKVTVSVRSLSSASSTPENFAVDSAATTITRNTVLWEDDLWRVGFGFDFTNGGVNFQGTITAIDVTGLIITYTLTGGTDTTGSSYNAATINLTSDLLAAEFHYGLIENSESTNYLNKIDGIDMMYQLNGITSSLADMNPASGAQSWFTGAAQIKQTTPLSAGSCEYVILQDFIIPYYKQTWEQDIEDGTLPTDLWNGGKTLKHVWNLKLRLALSNPNSEIEYVDDTILGSVGFFGENYNGLGNNYTFALTDYIDTATGDAVDGLQVDRKTTVRYTITSSGLFSSGNTKAGFYLSAKLSPAQYAASTTQFETLWIYDNLIVTTGTPGTAAGAIKRFAATVNNSSSMSCEADVEFSTAEQAKLFDSSTKTILIDECLIAGQVADHTLSQANSDKVVQFLAFAEVVKNLDVPGLATFSEWAVRKHPNDEEDAGYSNIQGYNEENYVVSAKMALNLDNSAYLKALRYETFAVDADGNEFIIEAYSFDLSSSVQVPTGVPGVYKQAFNLDTTRGYKHPTGDLMNRVRIGEFIDASPFRYGRRTLTAAEVAAEAAHVILQINSVDSGYLNNDYTMIVISTDGGGIDIANMVQASNEFEITPMTPGELVYWAIHNDADTDDTTGLRWGTASLAVGNNTIAFASSIGSTDYAVVIMDVPGGGSHTLVKAATGFDLTGITPGSIAYIAALYTGHDGIEAGVHTITAGANNVSFANPLASDEYILYWKDYENYGNVSNFAYTANGFTFDALVPGTLHFIAKMNE